MRAYININQKALNELSIKTNTKIDLIDATIFEYVYKFGVSNNATKQIIDDKLFCWCSYQKIIDDNPLLNISSKKAIEIRLNKLCELGLLCKFTDKEKGNKTFFNVTDLAYTLVIENTNLSNLDYQPLSNFDYYNSKLNNSKLNNNLREDDKKEKIDYDFFFTKWNQFAKENNFSTIVKLTDSRKQKIKLRSLEVKNINAVFVKCLDVIIKSNFLSGNNDRNWKVDFDWIFENDKNYIKILEGKYE